MVIEILAYRPSNGNVGTEWIELNKKFPDSATLELFTQELKRLHKADWVDYVRKDEG